MICLSSDPEEEEEDEVAALLAKTKKNLEQGRRDQGIAKPKEMLPVTMGEYQDYPDALGALLAGAFSSSDDDDSYGDDEDSDDDSDDSDDMAFPILFAGNGSADDPIAL